MPQLWERNGQIAVEVDEAVASAWAAYGQAFGAQCEAASQAEDARQKLFAAMMRRFESRLAEAGTGSMTFEQLYELGLPCQDCVLTLGPLNAHRHDIVMESDRAPYARCGAR